MPLRGIKVNYRQLRVAVLSWSDGYLLTVMCVNYMARKKKTNSDGAIFLLMNAVLLITTLAQLTHSICMTNEYVRLKQKNIFSGEYSPFSIMKVKASILKIKRVLPCRRQCQMLFFQLRVLISHDDDILSLLRDVRFCGAINNVVVLS